MTGYRRTRLTLALAALALSAGGLAPPLLAGAAASKGPHLVVTPVTGLTNGRTVKVSGTGFKPGDTVFIVECLANAKNQNGCNVVFPTTSATITPKGVLKMMTFKVTTGKVGNGYCGTKKANLKSCSVSAGNATGTDSAVVRIQFRLPKG